MSISIRPGIEGTVTIVAIKLRLNKVNFKLFKNSKARSSTSFKNTYMRIPQNKVSNYDCILDKTKTIEVPQIEQDVVNRYKYVSPVDFIRVSLVLE